MCKEIDIKKDLVIDELEKEINIIEKIDINELEKKNDSDEYVINILDPGFTTISSGLKSTYKRVILRDEDRSSNR